MADNSAGGDEGLGVGEGLREETLVGESVGGRVGSGGESDGREEQIHLDEGGLEGAFLLLRRVLVGNILAGLGHAEEANETAVAVEEVDVEVEVAQTEGLEGEGVAAEEEGAVAEEAEIWSEDLRLVFPQNELEDDEQVVAKRYLRESGGEGLRRGSGVTRRGRRGSEE